MLCPFQSLGCIFSFEKCLESHVSSRHYWKTLNISCATWADSLNHWITVFIMTFKFKYLFIYLYQIYTYWNVLHFLVWECLESHIKYTYWNIYYHYTKVSHRIYSWFEDDKLMRITVHGCHAKIVNLWYDYETSNDFYLGRNCPRCANVY